MQVQIGDFGMPALKKFCKLFNGYEILNVYSAPEIWEKLYNGMTQDMKNPRFDGKSHFFNQPKVDIYSFGMILWELEMGQRPFELETKPQVFNLLVNNKVRPRISPETNQCLALLIRRCWQEQPEKRPFIPKILDSLKNAEF